MFCSSWNFQYSEPTTVTTVTGQEDPFADLEASVDREMENQVQLVAPGSGISICLDSDNELASCYSLLTEQQLLEANGTSHYVMETESDDENEMEKEDTPGENECSNETTTLKNFKSCNEKFSTVSKTFLPFLLIKGS